MAYANVQNSGRLRTNTGAGISWSPGSAPTLNNLLTARIWGWNSGGWTPGASDVVDSSGTPKAFTRTMTPPTQQGGVNTCQYYLVVPSGLTSPLKDTNTATAIEGIFDEWSGNATSSVVDQTNIGSAAAQGTPGAGASITTGANAGLVLSTLGLGGGNVNMGIAVAGTSFTNDAIEQDNSSWQAGAADRRTASITSATLNDSWSGWSGNQPFVNTIASYNLSAGGESHSSGATERSGARAQDAAAKANSATSSARSGPRAQVVAIKGGLAGTVSSAGARAQCAGVKSSAASSVSRAGDRAQTAGLQPGVKSAVSQAGGRAQCAGVKAGGAAALGRAGSRASVAGRMVASATAISRLGGRGSVAGTAARASATASRAGTRAQVAGGQLGAVPTIVPPIGAVSNTGRQAGVLVTSGRVTAVVTTSGRSSGEVP